MVKKTNDKMVKGNSSVKDEGKDNKSDESLDASKIRNAKRRREVRTAQLKERKRLKSEKRRKRKIAEARGEVVERQTPRSIEALRRPDDSILTQRDTEVEADEEADEFAAHFRGEKKPKLFITTNKHPSAKFYEFLKEICLVLPNIVYYRRGLTSVRTVCKAAMKMNFTDVLLFKELRGKPHGLYICHLPEGPTMYFRISNVTLAQEMPGSANLSEHFPELLLNNFQTAVARRVARQLAALFPVAPEFHGRRVITFHNQRDFIFFRHHRYIFREKKRLRDPIKLDTDESDKEDSQIPSTIGTALQEIGPRFTLRLMWIHSGLFNTKEGLFEFVWRPDLKCDRKNLLL